MSRIRRTAALALVAPLAATLVAALALTGCGADNSGSDGSAVAPAVGNDRAERNAAPAAELPASGGKAAVGTGGATGSGAGAAQGRGTPAPTRLIRTAEVVVEVQNLAPSAARVRAVATALGGSVASETTNLGGPPGAELAAPAATDGTSRAAVVPGESVLVLRVPEPDLDTAVTRVEAVGSPLSRSSSSTDVTADIADLESRVSSQRASLARVRALMDRAGSLSEVVQLESELSRREADLEALQARLASLADRADLSTLTVTLRTPTAQPVDDSDGTGFVSGLSAGWDVLVRSTVIVVTVLGALLPPAAAVVAVGLPLWWLRRRNQARHAAARTAAARTAAAPTAAAPTSATGPATGPAGRPPADAPVPAPPAPRD